MEKLIENLNDFLGKVSEAKARYSVNRDIHIVAAGKFRTVPELTTVFSTGKIDAIGENRVQEFRDKYTPDLTWDIIGQLQTNKVKYVIGKVRLIQSLDRLNLADEIQRVAAARGVVQQCLIEINSGSEESKGGIEAEDLSEFVKRLSDYPNIKLRGVMAVAPRGIAEDKLIGCFSKARDAFLSICDVPDFDILSMGMSEDFPIAIKCGSNLLRPGRILFDGASSIIK